jgi:hypothetical protein
MIQEANADLGSRHTQFALLILFAGIAIRLVGVTQPYIDMWSWRQSDVAIIAENFYNYGYDFLHPQISWGGNVPGYVGTEFPLVPFLAAILYPVFGVQDWIGRAISIVFFAVSIPYLYALFRRFLTPQASIFGLVIYTFLPLGIFASRAFMSDTAALCLTIAGLFYFSRWLDDLNRSYNHLVGAIGTLTVAMLVKPSSFVMVVPAFLWLIKNGDGNF